MTETKNPFLEPYNTPHHTPPFHLIKVEHYEPAIREGMKEQNEEIDAIVNNVEKPNFQNTIVLTICKNPVTIYTGHTTSFDF